MPAPPRLPRAAASAAVLAALLAAACATRGSRVMPAVRVTGPLEIHVQHPPAGATIGASDSTFVFGRVEGADPSDVTLTVSGRPVRVHPSGGWLGFVPVEPDTFVFRIRAAAGERTAALDHAVVVPRPLFAPGPDTLPYKHGTIEPDGPLELYAGDTLRVSVVAAPGLDVRARIGEREIPLTPTAARDVNVGRQVWGSEERAEGWSPEVVREAAAAAAGREPVPPAARWRRYAGDVYLTLSGALEDSLALVFEGPDTVRHERFVTTLRYLDPTEVRVVALHDDTAGTGRTDHRVIARAGPGLGYTALLPNGTVAGMTRRRGGWGEIALGPGRSAWVPLGEAFRVPGPRPRSEIAVVRTRVVDGWSEVVLPTSERLPFGLEQRLDPARYVLQVYGLVSNVDFIETSIADPLIESIRWSQPENGVFRIDVRLVDERAWGWRTYWEGTHLVLSLRHPPPPLADRRFRSRLYGLRVVVDPGHHPDPGAVGPTGLEEREANLAIAVELARILDRRGAEVVLTRAPGDSGLGLYDRTNLAEAAGGEIFVSVHNNALPDGVNPFVHNGTSVLFYHPQSEALAEAIQGELLARTGLADHGVWHQNLAVLRMNEMPAVLVESAFMMIPEQEALLRTPAFRRRIAEGIAAGIERFLEEGDGR